MRSSNFFDWLFLFLVFAPSLFQRAPSPQQGLPLLGALFFWKEGSLQKGDGISQDPTLGPWSLLFFRYLPARLWCLKDQNTQETLHRKAYSQPCHHLQSIILCAVWSHTKRKWHFHSTSFITEGSMVHLHTYWEEDWVGSLQSWLLENKNMPIKQELISPLSVCLEYKSSRII